MSYRAFTNSNVLWLTLTAFLWGATNPLLKKTSKGICDIEKKGRLSRFIAEAKFLFSNWKYLLVLLFNQSGSVLYYFTLSTADLSLATPITNFLSLIFTGVVGALLGENVMTRGSVLGMALMFVGITICVSSRS